MLLSQFKSYEIYTTYMKNMHEVSWEMANKMKLFVSPLM
jgi:hypothetical protein